MGRGGLRPARSSIKRENKETDYYELQDKHSTLNLKVFSSIREIKKAETRGPQGQRIAWSVTRSNMGLPVCGWT